MALSVRKLLFLLALATHWLPSAALAATAVTQYVTTSCGNNGDGTAASCAGSPGGAGAFNSCNNWESQNTNLVSADQDLTVVFSGTCTSRLVIAGWTTDATRGIRLEGLTIATNNYDPTLDVDDDYVHVTGADLEKTGEFPEGDVKAVRVDNNVGFVIEKSIIRPVALTPDNSGGLIDINSNGGSVTGAIVRNNVLYDCDDHCINIVYGDSDTVSVQNNTIKDGTDVGVQIQPYNTGASATVNLYNNLADNNLTDFNVSGGSGTYNHDNNASSDTSSPDDAHDSSTFTFANAGSDDFHLSESDSDAIDLGTDLSGSFTDDFDGDTRSGTWDIGFDELAGGGGGGPTHTIILIEDY